MENQPKFLGVCARLATLMNVNVSTLRWVVFVAGLFATGTVVTAYFVAYFIFLLSGAGTGGSSAKRERKKYHFDTGEQSQKKSHDDTNYFKL